MFKIEKNKYFFPIGSWVLFAFISFVSFNGVNKAAELFRQYPKLDQYEIQLGMAFLVMMIAFYFMLSTIVEFAKTKQIRTFYYLSSIAFLFAAGFLIEKYYHQNAVFVEHGAFYNPSLLPLMFSIIFFITSLIRNRIETEER